MERLEVVVVDLDGDGGVGNWWWVNDFYTIIGWCRCYLVVVPVLVVVEYGGVVGNVLEGEHHMMFFPQAVA